MNQCKKVLNEQVNYDNSLQRLMSELDIGLKCKESYSEEEAFNYIRRISKENNISMDIIAEILLSSEPENE